MSTGLHYTSVDNDVAVSVNTDEMTGEQFVDELVIPVMLAAGYGPETIDDALASARIVAIARTIHGKESAGGTE